MRKALVASTLAALLPMVTLGTAASASASAGPAAPFRIEFWDTFGAGVLRTELGSLVAEFNSSHPGIRTHPRLRGVRHHGTDTGGCSRRR